MIWVIAWFFVFAVVVWFLTVVENRNSEIRKKAEDSDRRLFEIYNGICPDCKEKTLKFDRKKDSREVKKVMKPRADGSFVIEEEVSGMVSNVYKCGSCQKIQVTLD